MIRSVVSKFLLLKNGHMNGINKSTNNCYLCLHSLEKPKSMFESTRQGVICVKCGSRFCTWCINERRDGSFFSVKDTRCPKCLEEVYSPMLVMYEKLK